MIVVSSKCNTVIAVRNDIIDGADNDLRQNRQQYERFHESRTAFFAADPFTALFHQKTDPPVCSAIRRYAHIQHFTA